MEHKYRLIDAELIISDSVISRLCMFKQTSFDSRESGGLLIGRTDINGKTRIFELTEPMANDIRSKITFRRKDTKHLKILSEMNNKCLYYKGNWHTHPQASPSPSCIDTISWKRAIIKTKPGESDYIYFVIVGTDNIKVWCGDMKTHYIGEMEREV